MLTLAATVASKYVTVDTVIPNRELNFLAEQCLWRNVSICLLLQSMCMKEAETQTLNGYGSSAFLGFCNPLNAPTNRARLLISLAQISFKALVWPFAPTLAVK